MPRILPVPDMNVYEYVIEPDKKRRGIGQDLRHRVLRRREVPIDPNRRDEGSLIVQGTADGAYDPDTGVGRVHRIDVGTNYSVVTFDTGGAFQIDIENMSGSDILFLRRGIVGMGIQGVNPGVRTTITNTANTLYIAAQLDGFLSDFIVHSIEYPV